MSKDKPRQYGSGSLYQRSSDGRWIGVVQAGWTDRGTRRTVTVSGKTEAEARRKLDRKRHELANDSNASGDARITVKAWSETWLEIHERNARPSYYATDASAVRVWIVPTVGHKRLSDLRTADVRAVTNAVKKAGRTTTTARYVQGVLQRMLKAAVVEDNHPVPRNVLMVEPPARAANDREPIDTADARALLGAADAAGDASRWAAGFLQGMRQGECLGLTWRAVDFDRGVIDVSWQLQPLPYIDRANKAAGFRIPDGYECRRLHDAFHLVRPKTEHGQRFIPLVPWMADALLKWRAKGWTSPHDLVWPRGPRDGRGRTAAADREDWYTLQAAISLEHPSGRPYYLHEARNTTATLLLEEGVDPMVITAIMGHSSIATSRGYMRVSQALARKALDDVAARLGLGSPQIES